MYYICYSNFSSIFLKESARRRKKVTSQIRQWGGKLNPLPNTKEDKAMRIVVAKAVIKNK